MALPIAATPILKGKEAEKFRKQEIRNRKKLVPKKKVRRAIEIYKEVIDNY